MKAIILIVSTLLLCPINNSYGAETDMNLRENLRFFLYTSAKTDNPQQLYIDDENSIKTSGYDVAKATKFYIHGFNRSYLDVDSTLVRKGFLSHYNFNVIVIDWGNIAKTQSYEEASSNANAIGTYIAKMIDFLVKLGSDPLDMSLVGHSLAAQFLGSVGSLSSTKIGHIVGLDVTKKGFTTSLLSVNSAKLVEIIHTSDNSTTYGHLDFYPNGGKIQLGCENSTPDCSENRAYVYYAEALMTAKNWFAVQCDNYDAFLRQDIASKPIQSFPLAIGRLNKTPGTYYSRTAANEPYGLGFAGVKPQA